MLYEGTPGGSLDPSSDFWVRSNGQRALTSATVIGDIADPEWAYFGDRSGRRFLFLAHHEDDNLEDQYWQMENNMTVFGFGRQYASTTPLMTTVPAHLTVGFGEDTLQASLVINSAFRQLITTTGQPEASGVTPPPPPAGIVSDDFNSGTLNGALWTTVNPLNDAAVSMTGTQLRLSVPAGVSHDVWTGINNAPRVVQPIPNSDFSSEVKFDATMTAEYQFQGIIALQDGGTFVRMDFVRDAASLRFFAASFSGGVATVRADAAIASGHRCIFVSSAQETHGPVSILSTVPHGRRVSRSRRASRPRPLVSLPGTPEQHHRHLPPLWTTSGTRRPPDPPQLHVRPQPQSRPTDQDSH